ncbi:MAG TPA: aldo/keto reductase, partial [Naasia sp.]
MRTIPLSGLTVELSEVVLGTMTFGQQLPEDDAIRMVDRAVDAGITTFDTSNNYAGGDSERILGRALHGRRDSVLLSTKGGSHVDQEDASVTGLGRAALTAAVEGSLRRLGTDRIDIYYLHRPDRATPFEETLEVLRDLVAEGKILRVGQSNYAAWQITELNAIAEATGAPPIRIAQTMYNLVSRRVEAEYAECSEHLGLTDITYNPLAGGLLTG